MRGSDHRGGPYTVSHLALMSQFLSCAPPLPFVDSILDATREDIETIYRHRDELRDVSRRHRQLVCGSWATIYQFNYYYVIYEYDTISPDYA